MSYKDFEKAFDETGDLLEEWSKKGMDSATSLSGGLFSILLTMLACSPSEESFHFVHDKFLKFALEENKRKRNEGGL